MDLQVLLDNIEKLCIKKGVNKHTAFLESGVGKNFAYNIRNNKVPSIEKITALANYFDVTTDELIKEKTPLHLSEIEVPSDYSLIPVFETVSAGFGAYPDDHIVAYMPFSLQKRLVSETIVVIVRGDSMFPFIHDGDQVVVHKQDCVKSGEVGIVIIDDDEAVVKKIEYDEEYIRLISFNPMYPPRVFPNNEQSNVRIVGKVTDIIHHFD